MHIGEKLRGDNFWACRGGSAKGQWLLPAPCLAESCPSSSPGGARQRSSPRTALAPPEGLPSAGAQSQRGLYQFITSNKRTEDASACDQDGDTGTRFIRPETTNKLGLKHDSGCWTLAAQDSHPSGRRNKWGRRRGAPRGHLKTHEGMKSNGKAGTYLVNSRGFVQETGKSKHSGRILVISIRHTHRHAPSRGKASWKR